MRKFLIGLVVLLVAAVVADFTAAAYTEYRFSRALRHGAGLDADPEVTVEAFPFVKQALRDKFNTVQIQAQQVANDEVGEVTITATLHGVHLPDSNWTPAGSVPLFTDRVDGRMLIDPTHLGQFLAIPDLQVSAPPANKSDGTGGSGGSGRTTEGTVILSGTINLPELPYSVVSVEAELVMVDGIADIVATGMAEGPEDQTESTVPESLIPAVLALFTKSIDPRDLPFGITPTNVRAEGANIVIEGTSSNVTISLNGLKHR